MFKRVGCYCFLEKVGSGQFGEVYRAVSQPGDKVYAIKQIQKDKYIKDP